MSSKNEIHWGASGETVIFRTTRPGIVCVWAGDELDPAYLTPDEARRAADEWPAILRDLADRAEWERDRKARR